MAGWLGAIESKGGVISADIRKLAGAVAPYAPLLAKIIPIPGASILGGLIAALAPTTDAASLADQIGTNPLLQEKLKEFEIAHQVSLQQIGLSYAQLEISSQSLDNADRASARDRELKKGTDYFMNCLGISIIIGFYAIAIFVCYISVSVVVNANDKDVMMLVVGAALSCFTMVVSYYYGASKNNTAVLNAHKQLIQAMGNINSISPPAVQNITMMSEDDAPH